MKDAMTQDGAARLARVIEAFWATEGKAVKTHLELFHTRAGGKTEGGYCIRSNMVNGLPIWVPLRKSA
jgi:hypothetical protein